MRELLFSECQQLIADTLSADLQTRLLGQEVDDGAWIDEQGKDAHRVVLLAGLIFALKGSYADFGINRWFDRPRQELNGKSPACILTNDWERSTPDVETVIRLALFHAGPGPATPKLH